MNVIFEEQAPIARPASSNGHGITTWMIRSRIVDTPSHAQTVLMVAVVLMVATTALIGRSALSKKEVDTHKNFVPAVIR